MKRNWRYAKPPACVIVPPLATDHDMPSHGMICSLLQRHSEGGFIYQLRGSAIDLIQARGLA